ncbi:MAG: hypothetical protein IID36_02810 [Planctomycetes bacterium]|nr:hypothetical protein [Planctomycetota bacterium]
MRLALLQVRLVATSVSENVQAVTRAIDEAARCEQAPDLLVLPGACDTGGKELTAPTTMAAHQAVREAIASKAREWGVFIAAGLHVGERDAFRHAILLFDPDADTLLSTANGTAEPAQSVSLGASTTATAVGTIGVCDPREPTAPSAPVANADPPAVIAISCTAPSTGPKAGQPAAAATPGWPAGLPPGQMWAVVVPACESAARDASAVPTSFVTHADGSILVAASDGRETILRADVNPAA